MEARTRTAGTVGVTAAVMLAVMLAQGPATTDLSGSTGPVGSTAPAGSASADASKSLPLKQAHAQPSAFKPSGSSASRAGRPARPTRHRKPHPGSTTVPTVTAPATTATATPSFIPATAPPARSELAPVRAFPTPTPTTSLPTDPSTSPGAPAVPSPSTPVTAAPGILTAALPNRSGLPWASGVYVSSDTVAATEAFAAWRGRPVDVVVAWSGRTTWSDIVSPSWLYQIWANTPYTKVFGVAPIPEGDGSTLAGCASGDYNQQWVQFAQNIRAAGLDSQTIVRLGWEFNGNWYKWQASNPALFAACWRQIYTTAESVAPALRWDWTVNRGRGQSVADARMAYPGDSYVDFVGVDSYDGWPGAVDEASWDQQFAAPLGLKFWADFARVHHKLLSVPEWGAYPGTASGGNSGGDNAFYIAKMEEFFRSLGSNLGYESYFNEDKSYYAGSLFGPEQNPKAAAQYLRELRP